MAGFFIWYILHPFRLPSKLNQTRKNRHCEARRAEAISRLAPQARPRLHAVTTSATADLQRTACVRYGSVGLRRDCVAATLLAMTTQCNDHSTHYVGLLGFACNDVLVQFGDKLDFNAGTTR